MKKLRAAVIGCGGMGMLHARLYQQLADTDLVALAEIDPNRLNEAGKKLSVGALYADYRQMLHKEALDLLTVATQAPDHFEPTIAAAHAGCHVLCEKPMATELDECDKMIEACQRNNLKLAIHHQVAFLATSLKARQLIADGLIGDLILIRLWGKGYPAPYDLMEIGCHIFDQVRRFAGDVDWAFAHVTVKGKDITASDVMPSKKLHPSGRDCGTVSGDRVMAYYYFKSGICALGEFPTFNPSRNDYMGMEIIGSNGILRLQGGLLEHLFYYPKPRTIPSEFEAWQRIEVKKAKEAGEAGEAGGHDPHDPMAYAQTEPMRPLIEDFIQSIRENRTPKCSGYDGRAALEMLMAIYESQRVGGKVKFPLENRKHPLKELMRR